MNIVQLAMQYLDTATMSKLARNLGIEYRVVQHVMRASVPSVLGMLATVSKTAPGAGAVMDVVRSMVWGGSNDNALQAALEAGRIEDFAHDGATVLGGLVSGDAIGALSGSLSRHQKVDLEQATSLVGMVAPVALGTLRDRVDEDRLSGGQLAELLQSQSCNIAAAIPSDLASDLAAAKIVP